MLAVALSLFLCGYLCQVVGALNDEVPPMLSLIINGAGILFLYLSIMQ